MPMHSKDHWERVYTTREPGAISWFQEHADRSLALIRATGLGADASIIDVGGGVSTLVDDLLGQGFRNLTVLDLSGAALATARRRLGERAFSAHWMEADVTKVKLPAHAYDIWHDRAVFHFLTAPDVRAAYVRAVVQAVKPGGHVIVGTFAEDGPTQCSGLPVMRYRAAELHAEFGEGFLLVHCEKEAHRTPSGAVQQFIYCYCRKANS